MKLYPLSFQQLLMPQTLVDDGDAHCGGGADAKAPSY